MNKGYYRLGVLLLAIALVFGTVACAKPAPSPAPPPAPATVSKPSPAPAATKPPAPAPKPSPAAPKAAPPKLEAQRVATPQSGTGLNTYGVALAAIIEKYTGVIIAPQPTGSGAEVEALFGRGEVKMAAMSPLGQVALYQKDGAIRGIVGAYSSAAQFAVRADSKIFTFADLKGKRAMFSRPGQASYEDTWTAVLKAYGMTKDDIILMPASGQTEAVKALAEGTTDAFYQHSALPGPSFIEFDRSVGLRLLPIDADKVPQLLKAMPWRSVITVPVGIYRGTPKEILALDLTSWLVVNKSLPDDFTYQAAKALMEHISDFNAAHAQFKNLKPRDLVAGPVIPYAAGAYRYYKEAGLLTDEWDKKHKELLAAKGQDK